MDDELEGDLLLSIQSNERGLFTKKRPVSLRLKSVLSDFFQVAVFS